MDCFQGYCEALVGACASEASQPPAAAAAAAEAAMEVVTRLVEGALAEAVLPISALGWGSALDAVDLVRQLDTMRGALGKSGGGGDPPPAARPKAPPQG